MEIYLFFLGCVYVFYVAFESLASLARFGGFQAGYMSVGVSLQNQILSANRLMGFFIAPMIGFYADKGGGSFEVFFVGMLGSLFGGLALVFVYINWGGVSSLFSKVSVSFVEHGYSIGSLMRATEKEFERGRHKLKRVRKKFLFAQLFTTGLAMPSIFILNMMAIEIPGYSATLLQMSTVISGVGNLVLNFYTMPLLAVDESSKGLEEIEDIHKSIFWGKVLGMLILSPFLLCVYFLL